MVMSTIWAFVLLGLIAVAVNQKHSKNFKIPNVSVNVANILLLQE